MLCKMCKSEKCHDVITLLVPQAYIVQLLPISPSVILSIINSLIHTVETQTLLSTPVWSDVANQILSPCLQYMSAAPVSDACLSNKQPHSHVLDCASVP